MKCFVVLLADGTDIFQRKPQNIFKENLRITLRLTHCPIVQYPTVSAHYHTFLWTAKREDNRLGSVRPSVRLGVPRAHLIGL